MWDPRTLANDVSDGDGELSTTRRKPNHDQIRTTNFGISHCTAGHQRCLLGSPAKHGTGLIEIDREKCLEPLAAKSSGRIAYATDAGARILPVNYIHAESSIIFRTVSDGEI